MENKQKKLQFKRIEPGEKPFLGAFLGEERYFGLPNKVFKVYLEGEGDDGEKGFVCVQLINPKARKLTRFLINAGNFTGALDSGDFSGMEDDSLDKFITLTQELFQIPDTVVDKLTFMSIMNLIIFATNIAINPSSES